MREEALKWWKKINSFTKQQLCVKYYPTKDFTEVDRSSSWIESIYKKEHNL